MWHVLMPNCAFELPMFYNQFVYYYHADVHDGQWNDGGQVVAVGGAGYEGK